MDAGWPGRAVLIFMTSTPREWAFLERMVIAGRRRISREKGTERVLPSSSTEMESRRKPKIDRVGRRR